MNESKSKIGDLIECENCGKEMIKKSYQSKFCSNKGKGNCKDAFHNVGKRIYTFNRDEISELSQECYCGDCGYCEQTEAEIFQSEYF